MRTIRAAACAAAALAALVACGSTSPGPPALAVPTQPPSPAPTGPILSRAAAFEKYVALVETYELAGSHFAGVATGMPLSFADRRQAARQRIIADDTFVAGVRSQRWPLDVQPSIDEYLIVLAEDRTMLAIMVASTTDSVFDEARHSYVVASTKRSRAAIHVKQRLGLLPA